MKVYTNRPSGMNHTAKIIIALVVILFIAAAAYLLLGRKTPALPLPNLLTQFQPSPSPVITNAQVAITPKGFYPQTLKVKKGTKVTWINQDSRPHQVMPDPHPLHTLLPKLKQSTPMGKNATYSYIFGQAGTFTYHDEANPLKLKGVIIVEE